MPSSGDTAKRRVGDAIAIAGDYQHRALTEGSSVQRFWHLSKQLAIKQLLPAEPNDFILDIGCGSGVIASFLGESGASVLGIDGSIDAVEYASRTFGTDRIRFQQALVDETFSVEQAVDKIYCLEVIEHIYPPQTEQMLQLCYSVLRPGGAIFLTTPNYRSLWPVIEWGMDRFSSAAHLSEDQHVAKYTPRTLCALGKRVGFKVRSQRTMSFLAPWVAPLGFKLAHHLHRWEMAFQHGVGSICVIVLEKPETEQ